MDENVKDPLRDWTAELINKKGGASEVSKLTGLNYQVLREITLFDEYPKKKPTWAVFAALHRTWPGEVNLNALASGRIDEADKPDSKIGGAGNGSAELQYQEAEIQRLIKEAVEPIEKRADAIQEKYQALVDKVLAKAGFNWVADYTTGNQANELVYIDQPRLYFREQKYSEKEVAHMMADVTSPAIA
ncbi:hypothetical protein [Larkinella terrae]|uniref:Uncharacterized protein n=1 Tax=Larkinella terrae TaxID=2025311 RepID=A0A7K0EJ16_9BACT|nr:hypothetical protein [Larkinella terrae]MRS61732.1 hypothetical protein [Larkinella terrae]